MANDNIIAQTFDDPACDWTTIVCKRGRVFNIDKEFVPSECVIIKKEHYEALLKYLEWRSDNFTE